MRILLCCALLLCSGLSGSAASNRHKHAGTKSGTPAKFDYYLLTLSWSPEYCHGHSSSTQCSSAKHFGFVVHGLWPEYTVGGYPENCSTAPGLADPSKMLDIMPDLGLIDHEWKTHGTCSGLSADDYFALIRKAFAATHIPQPFQAPAQQFTISPAQISQQFSQANLKLPVNSVDVACQSNFFTAVEICLDKNLVAMSCPVPSPCRTQSIKVPPIPAN